MLRGSGGDYATLNKQNKTMLKLLQCVPFDLFAVLLNRLCGRLEVSVPPFASEMSLLMLLETSRDTQLHPRSEPPLPHSFCPGKVVRAAGSSRH